MILEEHGAAHLPGAAAPFLDRLEAILAPLPADRAGIRLQGVPGLADLLASCAAQLPVTNMRPVRAVLFDKRGATNWSLAWHQDRTIAVQARAEVPGFGPWSVKAGMVHVEPPFALIERMRTLRVHLDPVDESNAPLLIAPGSHRLGRIPEPGIDSVVARCGTCACLAERGDAWLYATAILHASASSAPAPAAASSRSTGRPMRFPRRSNGLASDDRLGRLAVAHSADECRLPAHLRSHPQLLRAARG